MSTRFAILDIQKENQANQLEVKLIVEKEQYTFSIETTEMGFSTPTKLDKILMQDTIKRSQVFIETLYRFQNGEPLEFPIELSET